MDERHPTSEGEGLINAGEAGQPARIDENQARLWSTACHLAALLGFIIPLGNLVGPLVIWLLKRNDHPQVDRQGKEAVNFQISVAIYLIVSALLIPVVIGLLLLPAVALFALVMVIVAAIKASNGEEFRYPLTIRLIK